MNTFDGYIRRDGTNSKVLLDGGDTKALSSFIGTLSYNNNKITYTKADGSTSYDLIDLSNYIYSLAAATSDNLGGIKIGFSQSGKNYPVELDSNNKAYVYVPWEANTHYTTKLYVGDGTAENKITTNGNTRVAITDDDTVRNYITLIGSGATTVSSDDDGKITINSTNTTYNTGDSTTLNTGTNTEGKLWSAKTLVDYISDILGVDSTAITSLNTLINQLHDNDTTTGILVELAKKLNTPSSSIGSNKQPIYWNGSAFTTIGYTIETSVPSNAVFTDTKYSFYVGENNNTKEHKNVSDPYFKLFENNTPTSIQIKAGTGISVTSDANGNITITNSSPDQNHNTDKTGIKLGTISGTKKTDSTVIINDSSTGLTIAGGTNKFSIGDGTNYIEVPITPLFTVSNKDATIGTSLITIATIDGTDIKAKIDSYLPLSGGTLTDALIIHTTQYNDFNEGIRILDAPNKWAGITYGATGSTGCSSQSGQVAWFSAKTDEGKFIIAPNSSSTTTGLTLNNGGDALWRNNIIYHARNLTKVSQLTNDSGYLTSQYTTGLYIGATEAKSNAATTNGNTYIKLFDNDTRRSNFKISGTQNVSVSSDVNGNVTITGPNLSSFGGGTITKISTGVGLTGGDITSTGTIKARLKSETASTLESSSMGSTTSRLYAVGVDKDGFLSVNIPWTNVNSDYVTLIGDLTISGEKTFNEGKLIFKGNEYNNNITNKYWDNDTLVNTSGNVINSGASIRNSLSFKWYNDVWHIGNICSSSSSTLGFGIALEDTINDNLVEHFRITTSGAYVNGNTVVTSANISNYAITSHLSLSNYYTKSETDTAITNKLSSVLDIKIVTDLPTTDINTKTLYLMSAGSTGTNDLYEEYVYINKGTSSSPNWDWEKLGTVHLNYSDFVTALSFSNNKLQWTKGSTAQIGIEIGYASYSSKLTSTTSQDPNECKDDVGVKLWYNLNTVSNYAGKNYGFPCSNNANGILWIGTQSGNYGGQIGISSNNRIYYRYILGGNFSTAENGGSWNKIAWASEIPTKASWNYDDVYLKLSGGTMTGSITMDQGASTRNVGIVGTYDYTKAAAIWAMGALYQIPAAGNNLGSLYGAAYVYQNLAGQGTMAGGHQFVWAANGTVEVALGNSGVWTTGGFIKNNSSDSYVLLGGGGHKAVSDFASSSNTMSFHISNKYLAADLPEDMAIKAINTYIEFWDDYEGGWYNFKLGQLQAVSGIQVLSNNSWTDVALVGHNHNDLYVPLSGNSTITGTITISPTNTSGKQKGLVLHDPGGASEACWIEWTSASYPNGVRLVGTPDIKTLLFWDTNAWLTVYHSGNLPAYPTKASWNYDDVYLKLSGGTISEGNNWTTIDFRRTGYGYGCVGGLNRNGLYFYHKLEDESKSIDMYLKAGDGLRVGGNLIWHAGNDGSGSGLDADLLDGKHYSDVILSNGRNLVRNYNIETTSASYMVWDTHVLTETVNLGDKIVITIEYSLSSGATKNWLAVYTGDGYKRIADFNAMAGLSHHVQSIATTMNYEPGYNNNGVCIFYGPLGNSGTCTIHRVKVERGDHFTGWTPAPEDLITTVNIGSQSVNYASSAGSVAWNNVSNKPSSMPASDVYAWAKASTKPSYTLDEVSDGSTRKLANYLPLSGGTMTGDLGIKTEADADWNITRGESKIRYFTCTKAANAPCMYASGVSFMTSYCGFLLGVHGETSNTTLYYRHCGDSGTNWSNWYTIIHSGGGNLSINGTFTATAFYSSSDLRLKNILTRPNYSAEQLASLPLVKYTWKDKENDFVHLGSIAQNAEEDFAELVQTDDKGYKSLDYATLGAIGVISLAREIVELRKEIKELKSKLYG